MLIMYNRTEEQNYCDIYTTSQRFGHTHFPKKPMPWMIPAVYIEKRKGPRTEP